MRNVTKKQKSRTILLAIIVIPLATLFVSNLFSYWSQIYKNTQEKKQLKITLNEKLDEEEKLKKQISKLEDPEYVARYAREKYLMSKNGEIIIKIDD